MLFYDLDNKQDSILLDGYDRSHELSDVIPSNGYYR
jgi:hypothetical protein